MVFLLPKRDPWDLPSTRKSFPDLRRTSLSSSHLSNVAIPMSFIQDVFSLFHVIVCAGARLETFLAVVAVGEVRICSANYVCPFCINLTHWYERSEVDHSRLNILNVCFFCTKKEA